MDFAVIGSPDFTLGFDPNRTKRVFGAVVEIISSSKDLDINFEGPVTDHELSDDCGAMIMGNQRDKFWHDNKGAKLNAIRTRKGLMDADIVIVRFGEKYKQWNAAFDAGYASALKKSIIVIHGDEHQHPLKEVDAAASAVAKDQHQAFRILKYILSGKL